MRRVVFPLMLLAIACQPRTTDLTDTEKAAIANEVNALNAEYWDAWRAADWDRGMSYYFDSPDFVWASGGTAYFGLDVLERLRSAFENVASQTFTFSDSRTVILAPDAVSVTAIGTWSQTDTMGVTGPVQELVWTGIWIRRNDEWKIHLVHLSYPPPRTEPR